MNDNADGDTIKEMFPGACRISGKELSPLRPYYLLSVTARNWRRQGRRDSSLPHSTIIHLPFVPTDLYPALKFSYCGYKPDSLFTAEKLKEDSKHQKSSHFKFVLIHTFAYIFICQHLYIWASHPVTVDLFVLLSVGRKQLLENEGLCQTVWTNRSDPEPRKYSLWEKARSGAS